MERLSNCLYVLFTVEVILVGWLFFNNGASFFQKDMIGLGILMPLGLLTFISVFFGFIYSSSDKFVIVFNQRMLEQKEKYKKFMKKQLGNKTNTKKLNDLIQKYEILENFDKKVNPEKWLYLSIFCYILTIIIYLFNQKVIISNLIIDTRFLSAILFHLGLITTFFLITSILAITLAYKKNFEK